MSAPSNAYLFGGAATFPIHIEGEIKLDSYPSLFLAEYENKIKETFYLDAFLVIDDEQGNKAFLGLVKDIPGSLNYRMHNVSRWFKQRLAPGDTNQPHIVMNDGGLNTKAFISNSLFTTSFANRAKVPIKTVSAYYDNSSRIGYYYRKLGDSTWLEQVIPNTSRMPSKTDLTAVERLPTAFSENTVYQFKFFIENPEGISETIIHPELMLFYVYEGIYRIRPTVCSATVGEAHLYYDTRTRNAMANLSETPVDGELYAYIDEDMTIEPQSGFYVGEDDWTYYYNKGVGFQFKTYCKAPDVVKLTLSMIIKPDFTWSLSMQRTEFLPSWQWITVSGLAYGRTSGGSNAGSIPYSITLNANENFAQVNGFHDVDYANLLEWIFGQYTVTSNGEINDTNIAGYAGTQG